MAIPFEKDAGALRALLLLAGYKIRGTRVIPGERGRSADIHLTNGVIVCWDAVSSRIWIDRFSRRGVRVEKYLTRTCEGSFLVRAWALACARGTSSIETIHTAVAAWLFYSQGFIAKILRHQISRDHSALRRA